MPRRPRRPFGPQNTLPPVPTTIFHQLPKGYQQQLAHLIADLIRRMHAARQNREGDHER
jgi:hypothetical protein